MDNSVCFEKFKDYLMNVKKASSNTLSSYLRDIRQFGEYLDSHETVGYTEADEEVLNGYISWLRGMGKSVATVSRSIASLKCFYTFLILQRIVSENPTGKLVPDKCEQKLPQILTSSEVELLLEQPECTDFKGYRDKAMLELLYATGIRVSELISLNVTDVNLTAGAIRCVSHDKERFIPLYPAAIRALSEYMEFVRPQMLARKDETSLFVNVSGERMSRQGFWKIIKSYQAKAHIEKDIEADRHTLPTRLGRPRARKLYHAFVFAWMIAIVVIVAAFFTKGAIILPFALLASYPLLKALLKNPLAPQTRIGAMAQICGVNIALGAFYAAGILASGAVALVL